MQAEPIRIGTRGSALALAQANEVKRRLAATGRIAAEAIEIHVIRTSGDRIQDRPLAEVGGKGLFTKEIEDALGAGAIDLAVHSMKDMPTALPDGLVIAALLEREDVRDAFLSPRAARLHDLPPGAVVGTSSLRRQAQVKRLRPDLEVVSYRGNVDTRLRKLAEGAVDATLLALAGLNRLGLTSHVTAVIETSDMLPAVAQGAIGIEIREDDDRTRALVSLLDHAPTAIAVSAERAFLARLDGSCRTPIAGLATLGADGLKLSGMLLAPDGSATYEGSLTGTPADGPRLGRTLAEDLLGQAGPAFRALISS
ncbi:MAG: hydroxymethylbilane synthase [Hyphomicrobiaceae bacterium]|nr:hydroxymethylbilane synthase [Hyphomicrobiaceae bacterium]